MIRSVLFAIIFWPVFGLYITLMYPIVLFSSPKFVFKYVFRVCARYLMLCLKYICKLDYEIEHKEILEYIKSNTPVILGCNHQSTWETFVFALYFDELSIVVKQELLSIPIAGLYFKKLGCLPIDRSHQIASIRSLLYYGQQAVYNKQNILIFPNGTRNSNVVNNENATNTQTNTSINQDTDASDTSVNNTSINNTSINDTSVLNTGANNTSVSDTNTEYCNTEYRNTEYRNTEYKSGIFALYKKFDLPVIPIHVNSGKFWARHAFKKRPGKIIVSFKQPILPGLSKSAFFKTFVNEMD